MLGDIPSIFPKGLKPYFCSIDSKLCIYEMLKGAPALLELVIWKPKIIKRTDGNIDYLSANMKCKCLIDSLSMVEIIVPHVLSFLTDGNGGNNLVNGDKDNDGSGSKLDEHDDLSDDGDEHNDDVEDGDGNGNGDGDNCNDCNDSNDCNDCDEDNTENDNIDGKQHGKQQKQEGNPSV